MAPKKDKAPSAPAPFVPTDDHHISLGQAIQGGSTITAYGNLVKGFKLTPAEAGTVHPHGKDEDLHLAKICAIQDQGECKPVNPPQLVYMPSPTGPADGCNLDPTKFVEWKSLPKDWITLHVQTQAKSFAAAVQPPAPAAKPSVYSVLRDNWLHAPAGTRILETDKLSDLWNMYVHKEEYAKAPLFYGAGQLAQALNKAYPPEWSWVKVDDTKNWVAVQDAVDKL